MGRHRFVLAIRSGLLASFRISANVRESCENSLVEHRAVAIAIRERNPETAEQAMHTLLAGTSRIWCRRGSSASNQSGGGLRPDAARDRPATNPRPDN
jgi:DNA-binding FadR family transcriptional regulator